VRTRLSDAVRAFATSMVEDFDRDVLLDELVDHVVDVTAADGAGIMLPDARGQLRFASASARRIEAVEQEQALIEQGACYAAFADRSVTMIDDLEREERWPRYRELCHQLGLRSVLGVPILTASEEAIGVINVYRDQPSTWTAYDVEVTLTLGAMGIAYVLGAGRHRAAAELADQLQHALDARVVIEQAKGFLMASSGSDEREALAQLRDTARNSGRKLRDVAREIVGNEG
jgi:GAF domain-containing protein